MAFDGSLAERVRAIMHCKPGYDEKKMFGGLGFLVFGNMCCGIHGDGLIARIGPDAYEDALKLEGVGKFDITGHAMKGWVLVSQEIISEPHELMLWIEKSYQFSSSLPPKE